MISITIMYLREQYKKCMTILKRRIIDDPV